MRGLGGEADITEGPSRDPIGDGGSLLGSPHREGQARRPKDTARSLPRGVDTGQWALGPALRRLSAPHLSLGAVLPWGAGEGDGKGTDGAGG